VKLLSFDEEAQIRRSGGRNRGRGPSQTAANTIDENKTNKYQQHSHQNSHQHHSFKYIFSLITQNAALPVTLLCFFLVEVTDEIILTSCALITHRYFFWHGSSCGFFLMGLGAFVLPANYIVEKSSHKYEERAILRTTLYVMIGGMLAILNWQTLVGNIINHEHVLKIVNGTKTWVTIGDIDGRGGSIATDREVDGEVKNFFTVHYRHPYEWGFGQVQFIIASVIIFSGTIVLEGVVTSLMAQVSPPKLEKTIFNCGLLATLFGASARFTADSLITTTGIVHKKYIFIDEINLLYAPLLVLCVVVAAIVDKKYRVLFA
jgi:hypothetical protein